MAKIRSESLVVGRLSRWQGYALIVGAVLFFFRDILLGNAYFWEDFLYQYYAFRSFAAVSLAGGDLPLWNPYTFNGMPFQADIQSAIFYLPNLALTFFVHGGHLSYWWVELSYVLHFILAGIGMFHVARSYGLEPWFGVFAGFAYCFSGFMVGQLIHQGFVYQAAWFPFIVLTFRKAVTHRSAASMILSGLLLGHALLAGAPQITLYIVFFLLLMFFHEAAALARTNGWGAAARSGVTAAGVIVIAVLLTSLQLLPTLELAPLSQRAVISYEKASEGSFHFSQLMTLVAPKYFGASGAGGSNYFGPGPYWHFWETAGYIGIPALVCAIVALVVLRRQEHIYFFGGVILFALLYSLGDNFFIHRIFHEYVPGFDNFRVPGRMLLLPAFCGSVLAAFGLRQIVRGIPGKDRSLTVAALCCVGAAAVVWISGQTGALITVPPGAQGGEVARIAESAATASAVVLLLLGVVIFLGSRRAIPAAAFPAIFLLTQFVDTYMAGFNQNNGSVHPDQYYQRSAGLVNLIREEGKTELFRVNSREGGAMILDRNQGMVDRIFLMEGYTPLGLARFLPPMSDWNRTADILNAKYRIVVDESRRSLSVRKAEGYAPRGFVVHDAIVAASEDDARKILSDPGFDYRRTAVFEEPPPVLHRDTGAHRSSVAFTAYGLNEISVAVETGTEGYLILSEIYYPGWKAWIDGVETPILRADWCLRALPIGAGTHTVVLEYAPGSFRTGSWISLVTLACCAAGLILLRDGNPGTGKPQQGKIAI